jgi:enoyl-CoA hydratase
MTAGERTPSPFEPRILVERRAGGVVWVRIADPARRNAMDEALGTGLVRTLEALGSEESVRVLVLTGEGSAFSAGGDLAMLEENTTLPPHIVEPRMRAFYARYLGLRNIDRPIIACLNGAAIGAGLCVALACDLRIAAEDAPLALNFTRIGLSPGMGATWLVPQLVGPARALDLLTTGRTVRGAEAVALGLVERTAPAAELEAAAQAWAEAIAAAAPIAVRLVKRMVHASASGTLDDALAREAFAQGLTFATQDMREGLAALRAKRSAEFSGS